ncbi:hypothetical protein [Hoeflea poritis]|uniref:Flagellar basal body-associated protein FliL n=1 Tax=Hoeflea poritis TaxID=2993659 RepID=A0ABT4VS73_9HYPH|nr:hypothetical protein [Hoeflea poritis]MDA4847565.1 hypothetical protein [Hoeflea poritis]
MIKLAISGVWICAVTLASVYFSLQVASETSNPKEETEFFGGLDYVRSDLMSIPAIYDGEVRGYFITRLVYTAEPEILNSLSLPPEMLITDELFSLLVGERVIDLTRVEQFDLDAFRIVVRDRLNDRLKKKVFHEVLVEQMEFLTKAEVRNRARQRRLPPPPVKSVGEEG